MKKIFGFLMAVAVLFTTSCVKEDISSSIAGGEVEVTFTANLPELGTRAETYGNASAVDKVYVKVYDANTDEFLSSLTLNGGYPVVEKKATVNIALVKGMKYNIVFWAQSSTCGCYTFNDDKTISVSYTDAEANDDNRDAFYAYVNNFDPVAPAGKDQVKLYRPFAQLNAATLDKQDVINSGINFESLVCEVEVVGACTTLDLTDGTASNPTKATFAAATIPAKSGEILPGKSDYDYLSMNYVLVNGKQLVKATYTISGARTAGGQAFELANNTYTNVPLQSNYRTNILGKLITKSTDFYVEIKPAFDNTEYEVVAVNNTAELQDALDNAVAGTTIELQPGVNYGKVYLRPFAGSPATKVVDWQGNNYRWETYSCFENLTIVGAQGATIDAIKVEGGTYYNTAHSQAATYPVMLSLVELKNVVLDGVTFTGKGGYDPQGHGNAINLSGNNIKVNGLTLKNCVLNNSENNARLLYKTESTTHVHTYTYNGETFTFSPSMKDITVTGCTLNGGYMGLELRETENVTITNNVFEVGDRNILLAVNSGCTYTGQITITGNTSKNAKERFVRADGAGDAVVVIKDNVLINYQGADADYIKVTNANNVTIENNIMGPIDPATKTIIVETAEDLLNLSTLNAKWAELYSNGQGTDYEHYMEGNGGKGVAYYYKWEWTIKLIADIDFENATINAPINIDKWGKFDGQNHTIKNLNVVTANDTQNGAGIFTSSTCSIENLVLDNIHVTGSLVGNSTAGILACDCNNKVEKITISNSFVWGGKYTGAVVGYAYADVTNCQVTNCVVQGGYKLGGIAGYICKNNTENRFVNNNTLTDCTVNGTVGQYADGKTQYIIGKVVGNFNCNGICQGNTITNMTTDATANIGKIESGCTVTE